MDVIIATLAETQHGVVGYWQLTARGIGEDAIQCRVAGGQLHRIHRAAFAVGHRKLTVMGHWMAAVLAAGEGALLSYWSAAALWGFLNTHGGRVHVTTAGGSRLNTKGIVKHRARNLHDDDRAERDGIPVTSLARTLLDLASVLSRHALRGAMERAEKAHGLDARSIREVCERNRGHRGSRRLMRELSRLGQVPDYRSRFEQRFGAFCREYGVPMPSFNVSVAGHTVDALWPRQRLIVELDSWEHHKTRDAFERDRIRDTELTLSGYRVVRLTWRRLIEEPAAVARSLRALMATTPA